MASGRQLAEENWLAFQVWRLEKTDDQYRQMVHRSRLSRSDIAAECRFSKSVLLQNPKIRAALQEIEDGLRLRGVLPLPVLIEDDVAENPMRIVRASRTTLDAERMQRLEQENASLRAEANQLRVDKAHLKHQLTEYAFLAEALSQTGRVPR